MSYESFVVTCKKCGGHDTLKITPDRTVFYTNHVPIISARFRPDMNWGFECQCGQDSRIAPGEAGQIQTLVQGGVHAIAAITASLRIDDKTKFVMEKV